MLATGTELGGYRIEGILGRGGMGIVYEAMQLSLSRTVALKLLAAELSHDGDFRDRFRREARSQAVIEHAHIVPVFEAGELPEGLYIAMRLVRGPNLKQLIVGGELDPQRAVRILTPIGDALDAAHEAELIHRDIKPQNILVGRRDHAFLADFGLTKGKSDTGYTRTGQLMGTVDYVAPEQIKGELATGASDIYALAAVAYECLVGRPPFTRPTELATLYAHVSDPPPRASVENPALPAAVDEVLAAGLAKSPADRPTSGLELIGAIDRAIGGSRAPAVTAPDSNGTATTVKQLPSSDEVPTVPVVEAPPEAAPGQPTEIVSRSGVPTRDDLRRDWTPEHAAAAAEADAARQERVAEPPPPKHEPKARRPFPIAVAAIAAVALASVLGIVLGGSGGEEPATRPAPERAAVTAGAVGFQAPAGWTNADGAEIAPLRFKGDVAGARDEEAVIAAGITDGKDLALLPPDLVERLDGRARRTPVRLGELQAYRYDDLRPRGSTAPITLFVSPTSEGVVTLACQNAGGEACGAAAATLEVEGAQPVDLGPRPAYAKAVGGALSELAAKRAGAAKRLASASRPGPQADAAADLSRAYQAAGRRIGRAPVSALEALVHPQLVRAVTKARRQWQALGKAARSYKPKAYAARRAKVRGAEQQVGAAVAALARLGYEVR
jgi:serine/threonine-protein kinase